MTLKKKDKVKVKGGRIGVVERVFYNMVNSKETDDVYCYEVNIDGVSGYIAYPDDIEE